jgi:hypothetical protein
VIDRIKVSVEAFGTARVDVISVSVTIQREKAIFTSAMPFAGLPS